jgi:hypothetical protein
LAADRQAFLDGNSARLGHDEYVGVAAEVVLRSDHTPIIITLSDLR